MRALVTGGAGFIGSYVVEMLVREGHDVIIFDNFESGRIDNIKHLQTDIQVVQADIRDLEALSKASQNVDWTFHLAALTSVPKSVSDPSLTHDINVTGTLNVLLSARDAGVARVVMSSSCAVYGNSCELPLRESYLPQPTTPYACSKLATEYMAKSFYHCYQLETICLRYFNVYGLRQRADSEYAAVIPRFIDCYRAHRSPTVYGDGQQRRDFVYVTDVARANVLAALCPGSVLKEHQSFNIGTSHGTSLLQLLDAISACANRTLAPTFYPSRIGDIRDSWSDSSLASEKLGFTPLITLDDGVSKLMQS